MACTGLAFSADDILGFFCALGSTGIFVAQNIYSKKLLSSNEERGRDERKGKRGMYEDGKMDKINVLFYSSGCSVVASRRRFERGYPRFYKATSDFESSADECMILL